MSDTANRYALLGRGEREFLVVDSPYFEKVKGGFLGHLAVCLVSPAPTPQCRNSGTRGDGHTILYKHMCDMTLESRNSAVRSAAETAITRQWIGNYIVQLWGFCSMQLTLNHGRSVLWVLLRHLQGETEENFVEVALHFDPYTCGSVRTFWAADQFLGLFGLPGARGGVVGWGTMLKAGRSRVPFPARSLESSTDLILPEALWPWGRFSL
jgi:hypothetical protein